MCATDGAEYAAHACSGCVNGPRGRPDILDAQRDMSTDGLGTARPPLAHGVLLVFVSTEGLRGSHMASVVRRRQAAPIKPIDA